MRNLQEIASNCMYKLDVIGIKYGTVNSFTVNTRAKKRWGQCKDNEDGSFSININAILLEDSCPLKGLEETILHELIHTCDGCFDHKQEWKRIVSKVNNAYGYNIKTTNSAADKGLRNVGYESIYKYACMCTKCGKVAGKNRMCDFIKYPINYSHKKCGGYFVRIL